MFSLGDSYFGKSINTCLENKCIFGPAFVHLSQYKCALYAAEITRFCELRYPTHIICLMRGRNILCDSSPMTIQCSKQKNILQDVYKMF